MSSVSTNRSPGNAALPAIQDRTAYMESQQRPILVGFYRPQAEDHGRAMRNVQAVVAEFRFGSQGRMTFKLLQDNVWGQPVDQPHPAPSSAWVNIGFADAVLLPCFRHNDAIGLRDTVAALTLYDSYLDNDELGGKMRMESGPLFLQDTNDGGSYTMNIWRLVATVELPSELSAGFPSSGVITTSPSSSTTGSPGPTTPSRAAGTSLTGTPGRVVRSVARNLEVPLPKEAFVKTKRVLLGFYRGHRSRDRLRCQAVVAWIDKHGFLHIRPARHNIWGNPLSEQDLSLSQDYDVPMDQIFFLPKFERLVGNAPALRIIVAKLSLLGIRAPVLGHWDTQRLLPGIPYVLAKWFSTTVRTG